MEFSEININDIVKCIDNSNVGKNYLIIYFMSFDFVSLSVNDLVICIDDKDTNNELEKDQIYCVVRLLNETMYVRNYNADNQSLLGPWLIERFALVASNRIERMKNEIGVIIPNLINDCMNQAANQTIYYRNLTAYGDLITKLMKKHFIALMDIEDFYSWLGLDNKWVRLEPYIGRSFNDFFDLFVTRDNGLGIVDKITTDLFAIKYSDDVDKTEWIYV